MSALGRWLRELRGRAEPPPPPPPRHHPAYHSERRRRHKPAGPDHRRHSFNHHPHHTRCEMSVVSGGKEAPVRERAPASAPGHEKFPSWPVAAAAERPARRGPITGGSTRSKSWTDHTEYPKEQPLTYTRPYMRRHHQLNKHLNTVLERTNTEAQQQAWSYPSLDRDGKCIGDRDYAVPSPPERDAPPLTQADLDAFLHHKQPSYAHSEGYHSLVSSADSTATPFLDRLRRDLSHHQQQSHSQPGGRDSVVTTSSSSASASSSDTLKWHGSLSDVSTPAPHQLIAHSARVQTPQRHHSESVLYMVDPTQQQQQQQQRKLYPVSTYTVQPRHQHHASVQDRVNELERHQRYTYLDPEKKHRVSDPTLKAIQKKALLSFYERHHGQMSWRSEPQLAQPQVPTSTSSAPLPPPRVVPTPTRRASCASDYSVSRRTGPVIVGPAICVDEWVPERPPKHPALRYRAVTPPPPSPPPTPPPHCYASDEPLPPPPADLVGPPAPPARPWQRQSFSSKPLPPEPPPPPLQPRTARVNQSMRARITTTHTQHHTMSASKASYLASRRERDLNLTSLPDSGSYKRTMSPCGDSIKPPPLPDVLPQPRDTTPPPASPVPVPVPVQVQVKIPISQPSTSPTPQPLQLVQRAEITLRVSAPTSDAGCQTDQPEEPTRVEEKLEKEPTSPVRPKLQEEIDCERLQQDLAEQLGHSDRLKSILAPGPEHRKPTDYVSASGLFKLEVTARRPCSSSNLLTPPATNPANILNNTTTLSDLERKKEELVSRLARKLAVLQGEAAAVDEERQANDLLGASVARKVSSTARPHEAAKFRLHVDEVGHITALLLALSARLARAENALMAPDNLELEQRKILEEKRDKLAAQLQEAKQLKESIDKRSNHVSNMLVQYLSASEYADYDHFINMKAKLIMDARDIADKMKLGEEQLQALKDTLADV